MDNNDLEFYNEEATYYHEQDYPGYKRNTGVVTEGDLIFDYPKFRADASLYGSIAGTDRYVISPLKTKDEYINAFRLLEEIDIEQCHRRADAILCQFLMQLGHEEMVKAYKNLPKWYT